MPDLYGPQEALDDFEWHLNDLNPDGHPPGHDCGDCSEMQLYIDVPPVSVLADTVRAVMSAPAVWWCDWRRAEATPDRCQRGNPSRHALCGEIRLVKLPEGQVSSNAAMRPLDW